MKGIDFVTNKRGQKTAVLIDLKRHGQLWEDFYDSVVARNRAREPRETLDAVKDRLRRAGAWGSFMTPPSRRSTS
jgi:hypothetical protein